MQDGEVGTATVLIIEDHHLLAQSLGLALEREGFTVWTPAVAPGTDLVAEAVSRSPSVVLLDLDLGPGVTEGVELVPEIASGGTAVVVLSGTRSEERIGAALEAGAVGYVSKQAPFERLLEATRDAAAGRPVIATERRHQLVAGVRRRRLQHAALLGPFDGLTPKEREVLLALGEGSGVEVIATRLTLSKATVRTHVRGVLSKLEVSSQLAAVAKARRAGWLPDLGPLGRW